MNEITNAPAPKRRAGRPPKIKEEVQAVPAKAPTSKYKMKAKPNWEDVSDQDFYDESVDKLHIPRDMIPDGMDLQWVADSLRGQPQTQRRAEFERRGWTPVHQSDFDNRFDGMWMSKGAEGEINYEGTVLMARPLELSRKARLMDRKRALNQVQLKEHALLSGELPVTLDAQHPTAVNSNRINRSFERIQIPKD